MGFLVVDGYKSKRALQYLNHGESGKEDEVDGSLLALHVEGDQEAHGEEEGREEHPGIALHCLLHSRREQQNRTFGQLVTIMVRKSESTYYGGDRQLNCKQPIHLSHEPCKTIVSNRSNAVLSPSLTCLLAPATLLL